MVNYYEILGLKNNAEAFEIKVAFRQLAKLYHPDKNPLGNEQFAKLLKAYETLINPETKLKYDYKLNYDQSQVQQRAKKTPGKRNNFEEQELKRRQYYNEHIKKYEKKKTPTEEEPDLKENYNEYKYILFATPLAVLLFLLIVNLASNDRTYNDSQNMRPTNKTEIVSATKNSAQDIIEKSGLQPEIKLLGQDKYDPHSGIKLRVSNLSRTDIILCLFNSEKEFVRLATIADSSSIELDDLPRSKFIISYCSLIGPINKGYSEDQKKDLRFYKSNAYTHSETINPLTLLPETNKGFVAITKEEFFESIKK